MKILCIALLVFSLSSVARSYRVEGRVHAPYGSELTKMKVVLDDGAYFGFVKSDGHFTIFNVPKGSYVAQAVSSTLVFEPVRVEINYKGAIRARKLNHQRPSAITLAKYPLDFKAIGAPRYFQQREKFSVFDLLKNPYVLTMILPVLILAVLPKMVNSQDPELRKEVEESMKMFSPNQNQMPDMSDVFTKWFGNDNPSSTKKIKSTSQVRNSKVTKRR